MKDSDKTHLTRHRLLLVQMLENDRCVIPGHLRKIATELLGENRAVDPPRLVRRFEDAYRSAASKEYVSELTEEEACAICMFAGVPYEIDFETGRVKFNPCGIYKRQGKWIAVLPPNVLALARAGAEISNEATDTQYENKH